MNPSVEDANGLNVEEVPMLSNGGSNEHETSSSSNKDKVIEAIMSPGSVTNQQNPSEEGVMTSETNSPCMLCCHYFLLKNNSKWISNIIFLFPVWEHANGQVNGLQSEDQFSELEMISLNVEEVPMMSNGGNNEHETSSQRYIGATYRKLFNSLPLH